MPFKCSVTKKFQIGYNDTWLCSKDVDVELTFSIDNVYSDAAGNLKATVRATADSLTSFVYGEYAVSIDTALDKSWTEQAESQLMAIAEFSGATSA